MVDASELNYLMRDRVKAFIVVVYLVVDDRSIQKISVMSVVIGGIMPAIVDVLKEEDAGHTLLLGLGLGLGLDRVRMVAVVVPVQVRGLFHVPVQGLPYLVVRSPGQDLAVDKQSAI